MSITSISTTTAGPTATTASSSTTAPVSTGLSGASSIASAAPAATQGCSAQISAWFASCIDAIRGCLAKLPLIGSWFDNSASATTTTPGTSSTLGTSTTTWTDADLVRMIAGQFVSAGPTTGATVAVPAADVVNYTLTLFGQIQSPVAKMEAFGAVLGAINSTDDIARQFYGALPEGTIGTLGASRSSFREYAWIANGRNDNGHGPGYGDHVVQHEIRTLLAQTAVQNLRNALATAASSTGTSTTGP